MKAVLISVRPEWADKIISGEKTLEVRKNRPKLEPPFMCYIYRCGSGKIVGKFMCDYIINDFPQYMLGKETVLAYWRLLDGSCLNRDDLINYGGLCTLHGWHISDLHIYGKPLPLSEFRKPCNNGIFCESCAMYSEFEERCGNDALTINRPPQSWCYVEELEYEQLCKTLER